MTESGPLGLMSTGSQGWLQKDTYKKQFLNPSRLCLWTLRITCQCWQSSLSHTLLRETTATSDTIGLKTRLRHMRQSKHSAAMSH